VVKEALRLNAAAIIFSHNHPSGHPEPSEADKALTRRLKQALDLVDVRTLDHVIVAGDPTVTKVHKFQPTPKAFAHKKIQSPLSDWIS